MAKPRVFVSSTYYDLKYARERLERFIKSYNMEPVLFESDNVYFDPTNKIDKSCYNEVETCHLMLLIVGGRYGSPASNSNEESYENAKEKYNEEYVSITQKEYITAVKNNIPIIICVDRNVYSDYETYLINNDNNPNEIKYAHTEDCKIFEFISTLQKSAIKLFNKIEDIEHYFSNQISGMLYTYLESLKKESKANELKSSIDQIEQVAKSMSKMLNEVASEVIVDKAKYNRLIEQQQKSLIDFFFTIFKQNCIIQKNSEEKKYDRNEVKKICEIFNDTIFNVSRIENISKEPVLIKQIFQYGRIVSECTEKLSELGYFFKIKSNDYRSAFSQISDLNKDNNSHLKKYFNDKLEEIVSHLLLTFPGLPFTLKTPIKK